MRLYGLLGYPLGHSFSARYFTGKFVRENIQDTAYRNYALPSLDGLADIINGDEVCGLNVTIPYKEKIIPFLDAMSPDAEKIGAVNVVKIDTAGGKKFWKGYNTDTIGFEKSFLPMIDRNKVNAALVLGTGGASKAVCYVLGKLGIPYSLVSRSGSENGNVLSYGSLSGEVMKQHNIIINTTPLGMFPAVDTCPDIPYGEILPGYVCYDLVYNPEETLFMKKCREQGALVKGGLEMLETQAEAAWEIWNK